MVGENGWSGGGIISSSAVVCGSDLRIMELVSCVSFRRDGCVGVEGTLANGLDVPFAAEFTERSLALGRDAAALERVLKRLYFSAWIPSQQRIATYGIEMGSRIPGALLISSGVACRPCSSLKARSQALSSAFTEANSMVGWLGLFCRVPVSK